MASLTNSIIIDDEVCKKIKENAEENASQSKNIFNFSL